MAARIGLIVAALVVGAWFALTLRALWLEDDARALIPPGSGTPSPAAIDRMDELLRDAARWNPDIRPTFLRGYLLALAGEHRRSAAVFEDIVRREPENGRALAVLYTELRRVGDREAAERVRERLAEVAPPPPPE